MSEILVGVDIGCRRHRVAIGEPGGLVVEEFDLAHGPTGFTRFFSRVEYHARRLGLPVVVGMEGYGGWARPLDEQVMAKGWKLLNVNNLKLARFKEIFPSPAKTDAIDARKIVELMRLHPLLPQAKQVLGEVLRSPRVNQHLKVLSRHRSRLVDEKVLLLGRMHADLQAIAPGLLEFTGSMDNLWFLRFLTARECFSQLARMRISSLMKIKGVGRKYAHAICTWQQQAQLCDDVDLIGEMVIADARRVLALLEQIRGLEQRMGALANQSELARSIDSIPGFGVVCAAELAGEIGAMERFDGEAGLARYIGMAPLDNSSGEYSGTRAGKQVNRRAKAAMMTAVARHYACVPQSKAYYDKKRAEGKKHNQAVRALGRHLARVIWSLAKQNRSYQLRITSPSSG